MTIAITDFDDLTAVQVAQEQATLAEMMQESNPALKFLRGVLHDYLAYYGGVQAAKNVEEMARLQRSQSLNEVVEDPTLADDDTVENIASNFLVTRLPGTAAAGEITIIIDTFASVTIASGAVFEGNGQEFTTEHSVTARTSSALLASDTDVVLAPLDDGTYAFNIPVVAREAGIASRLTAGTLAVPQVSFTYYTTSYAAADFTGGADEETNAEMIERFRYGISAKALSGRTHMSAALREQSLFQNVISDSIIGLGDSEMIRDQHTIWPGSLGGRVDWYVRTQDIPQTTVLTKTATLVEKTADGKGIWQISFTRDEVPGLYDTTRIALPTAAASVGTYEVLTDVRSVDLTALDNDGFLPDIDTAEEGAYSRFQAVIIRFKDVDTDTVSLTINLSTASYSVSVRAMANLEEAQDYVSGRAVRNTAGDCLVKAPVPCFMQVSFVISMEPGQSAPDTATIATDLASLVNQIDFTGRLPASALSDVIHNHLAGNASVSAIDMLGRIRKPDGTFKLLHDTALLEVPDEPQNMVTSRTVAFILDPNDVAISVETADIAEV